MTGVVPAAGARQVPGSVPVASRTASARILASVVAPILARGVILRRPRVVALAERLDADRRAVRALQRLRRRYGPGPVRLRLPARELAVMLSADHVREVLERSPETFVVSNLEKRGALSHFQPDGLLVSDGELRAERRRFNEAVLDTARPVHHLADAIVATVREEGQHVAEAADGAGVLTWDDFIVAWWRMVRRIVLGDAAADDATLTDELGTLRAAANWSYLRPRRTAVRRRFMERLRAHVDRAEPGSLAALVAGTPASAATAPVGQVPQWLFAFDAAGIATFRALALLAAHPAAAEEARREAEDAAADGPRVLPHLRACLLESVRLWPTTPVILRDTRTETRWGSGTLPAGTAVLIIAALFHRDDETFPFADRFAPELWADGGRPPEAALVPFSAGPAECAGRNLVLLVASTMLAALLERHRYRLQPPGRLGPDRPLPGTLDPFRLRFVPQPD